MLLIIRIYMKKLCVYKQFFATIIITVSRVSSVYFYWKVFHIARICGKMEYESVRGEMRQYLDKDFYKSCL